MVLHFITISEGERREILYLRPLSEYSKGGDTGRTDKPDPTRDPSSQSQKYSDEFDELILNAVQKKYPDAKPSFRLIYFMEAVEQVVTGYKGRLLKYLEKEVPKAFVCYKPFDNDCSLYPEGDLPSVELAVVGVCGTKVIGEDLFLSCGLDELRRIDGIFKKAIRVSFVEWFMHYFPSVEGKYSEEETP